MIMDLKMVMRPLIGLMALGACSAFAQQQVITPTPSTEAEKTLLEKRSQVFTENRGQWDARARFMTSQPGLDYWVTNTGVVLDLNKTEGTGPDAVRHGHVVRIDFNGASTEAASFGVQPAKLRQDFYVGTSAQHAVGVQAYSEAFTRSIYDRITVRHYKDQRGTRYDLIVMPGGDPSDIEMQVSGADYVAVDEQGTLRIVTALGEVRHSDLYVYQPIGGRSVEVPAEFVVSGNSVKFKLGSYNPAYPVIIDPLVYGSFVGSDAIPFFSSGNESVEDIVADARGNVYMVGNTNSITFPIITGAYQTSLGGGMDAFLIRMRADAYALDYATYFGGAGADFALGVGLDQQGTQLFMAGTTTSANLPGVTGFVDANDPGAQPTVRVAPTAYFLTKFNIAADGTVTGAFSRYYNRPGNASGNYVQFRVSPTGRAFLAGAADNADLTGAGAGNPFTPFMAGGGGNTDGWVASFDNNGNVLYQSIIGGPGDDTISGIDVNAGNTVVAAGYVPFAGTQDTSTAGTPAFPTTAGVFPGGRLLRNTDAYIVRIDDTGAVLQSAVFGSSGIDGALSVCYDPNSNVYIAGAAGTPDFPRTPGAFNQDSSRSQQFLSKFSPDLGAIVYSTLLETTGNVTAEFLDADERGYAYVAGQLSFTANPPIDPMTPSASTPGTIPWGRSRIQPLQGQYRGGDEEVFPPNTPDPNDPAAFPSTSDAFIMVMSPSGSEAAYVDNIGQLGDEFCTALHVDTVGAVWIGGTIDPIFNALNQLKQPHGLVPYITPLAFKSTADQGSRDAWAVKLRIDLPILDSVTIPPPGAIAGGLGAFTDATITLRDPAPVGGVTVNVTLSDVNVASFSPTPGNTSTTVTIPTGGVAGTVRVYSLPVTSLQNVDIRATLDNDFKLARLTVAPWLSDLTVSPSNTPGGNDISVRVVLFQNATQDITIPLSTSDSSLVNLPSPPQIVVPAGSATSTLAVGTNGVTADTNVTINGNLLGVNKQATVTLTPAQLSSIVFNPNRVNGGESSVARIELNGKAGSDRTITITQDTMLPGVTVNGNALPTDVVIPAQQRFVDVTVTTPRVASTTNLILRATEGARSVTGTLVVDDIDILELEVEPATDVLGGTILTGRVRLTRAAGPNGFTVDLSSSNTNAVVVGQATVTIPANSLVSPDFQIQTLAVNTVQTAVVTASKSGGFTPRSVTITVRPMNLTLTLAPTSVLGGVQTSVGTATISEPAPANGIPLVISSSDPSAAVPANANVTIPAGQTFVTFTVNTFAVPSDRNVTITATAGPLVSASANLEVRSPDILSLELNPSEINGGDPATGTLILEGPAPSGGLTVALSANPTGIISIPGSVVVPAGADRITFPITSVSIPVTTTVTVTATVNGQNVTDTILVRGPQVNSIVFDPGRVRGGRQTVGTILLSQPAPAGGYTVTITSLSPQLAVPVGSNTVTIPAGQTTANFRVATNRVSRSVAVRFRATGLDSEAAGVLLLIP